jgi:hypothetical protein
MHFKPVDRLTEAPLYSVILQTVNMEIQHPKCLCITKCPGYLLRSLCERMLRSECALELTFMVILPGCCGTRCSGMGEPSSVCTQQQGKCDLHSNAAGWVI